MKKLITFIALISALFAYKPIENYIYSMPKQALNNIEIQDLKHMREEEKLARDVYLTLYEKWRLPVFKNISKSESWHMHMIKVLLDKYGLNDPVAKTGDRVGVFTNQKLQKLYYKLVNEGSKSVMNALKVGATIEDLDIKDLDEAINRTDNQDIKTVYANLRHGSENHMRAFVGLLRRYGGDYTPQFISQEEFNAIINSKKSVKNVLRQKINNYTLNEKVLRVYTLPGLRRGVTWIMLDVESHGNVVKVALAPTWVLNKADIHPGDYVVINGYQGPYSFIVCNIKDNTSGFEYQSKTKRCMR